LLFFHTPQQTSKYGKPQLMQDENSKERKISAVAELKFFFCFFFILYFFLHFVHCVYFLCFCIN